MSASQFASFTAYTPPPDDRNNGFSKPSHIAWVQTSHESSYQSGGIPSLSTSFSSAPTTEAALPEPDNANLWETTYGWRTDVLAFWAYILSPFSAFAFLIWETQNDYVRFHAYQSAILYTFLMFTRMLLSLLSFSSLIKGIYTWAIIITQVFLGAYAYREAASNVASPFKLPVVGLIAEKWLAEE